VLSWEKKEVPSYAFIAGVDGSRRGGRTALGGEPDSDAGNDQVHFERCRGDSSRDMASECFWIYALAFKNANRDLSGSR
jgi:hypothetical protein